MRMMPPVNPRSADLRAGAALVQEARAAAVAVETLSQSLNRMIAGGARAIATIVTAATPGGRGIPPQAPPVLDRPSSTRLDAAHQEVDNTGYRASAQAASTPLLLDELQHDRVRMAATPRVQALALRDKHNMAPTSPTMLRELLHLGQSNFLISWPKAGHKKRAIELANAQPNPCHGRG